MKNEELFRATMFGGYKKADVLKYVMNIESAKESESMSLQEEVARIKGQLSEAGEEKDRLKRQLSEAETERDKARKEKDDIAVEYEQYIDKCRKEAKLAQSAAEKEEQPVTTSYDSEEIEEIRYEVNEILQNYRAGMNESVRSVRQTALNELSRLKQKNIELTEQMKDMRLEILELTAKLEEKEMILQNAEKDKQAAIQEAVFGKKHAAEAALEERITEDVKPELKSGQEEVSWTELNDSFKEARKNIDTMMEETKETLDRLFSKGNQ